MNFKNVFQSKILKIALWCLAGLIVSLLIFKAGTIVGLRKAGFSYKWGENYHQNFGGPRKGFFRNFDEKDFISGHGVFGQIIKIDTAVESGQTASSTESGQTNTLIIKGQDNVEKIVLVKSDTVIQQARKTIQISDLKVDDSIVVIGEPNEAGQIEAKFIRLSPLAADNTQFGRPIQQNKMPFKSPLRGRRR